MKRSEVQTRTLLPVGLRYIVGSAFFFSLMTLCVKAAGQRLPSHEIVLARGLVTLGLTHWMVRRAGISPWGRRRGVLMLRGLLGFLALSLFYFGLTRLPLAEATVLHYTSPIWTAVLAVPLLGEAMTPVVLGSTVLSLAGVALIARPDFLFGEATAGLDLAAVGAVLSSAVLSAGAYVAVREASKTEHDLAIIYYFAAMTVVGALPLALPVAIWPTPAEWAMLAGVGITTQLAQVCLTRGLGLEPAGRAMTAAYTQILFAAFWGAIFFAQYPSRFTVAGAALIVLGTAAAGLRVRRPTPQP